MEMTRLAAVDIGSLTVRLAVAEVTAPGKFHTLVHRRQITALGQGLEATGELGREAWTRTLKALEGFGREIENQRVEKGQAVATEAVRQARNGEEFLKAASQALHLPVSLITPEEEAALTVAGVLTALDPAYREAEALLVFDVGGASSEFILLRPGHEPFFAGLPLGVLTVTQARPVGDPPQPARVEDLKRELRRALQDFYQYHFGRFLSKNVVLVGTAGAVTTLAAMAQGLATYDPKRVNNFRLDRKALAELAGRLTALPEAERARLPGLEPAKAGVIIAGVLIVQAVLAVSGQEHLVAVDAGLLEGVLSHLAHQP